MLTSPQKTLRECCPASLDQLRSVYVHSEIDVSVFKYIYVFTEHISVGGGCWLPCTQGLCELEGPFCANIILEKVTSIKYFHGTMVSYF